MKLSVQNIIAVIVGIVIAGLAAVLLFPLVKIALAQNITIGKDFTVNTNDIGLTIIEFLWVGIASYIGGFVTSWIADSQKVMYALITGTILFLILLVAELAANHIDLSYFFLDFSTIMFSLCGGLTRKFFEVNKLYKNSLQD